jgi:hypothetical protein
MPKAQTDSATESVASKLPAGVYRTPANVNTSPFFEHISPSDSKPAGRVLFTRKSFDADDQKWRREEIHRFQSDPKNKQAAYCIKLNRGGVIHVFPNLLDAKRANDVEEELLACDLWRTYTIQSEPEPRLHFLL